MVLWYDVISRAVAYATDTCSIDIKLKDQLLWAVASTFGGAAFSGILNEIHEDALKFAKRGRDQAFLHAAASFVDLLKSSLAWVVGCAWTDVICAIFSILNEAPYLPNALANIAVACLVSVGALLM